MMVKHAFSDTTTTTGTNTALLYIFKASTRVLTTLNSLLMKTKKLGATDSTFLWKLRTNARQHKKRSHPHKNQNIFLVSMLCSCTFAVRLGLPSLLPKKQNCVFDAQIKEVNEGWPEKIWLTETKNIRSSTLSIASQKQEQVGHLNVQTRKHCAINSYRGGLYSLPFDHVVHRERLNLL